MVNTVENITQSEVLGWEHVTTFLHLKGPDDTMPICGKAESILSSCETKTVDFFSSDKEPCNKAHYC